MDVFKFIILSVACVSGFMVTSYEGVAQQKGWKIGSLLSLDQLGYIAILGFICQWGSVIISFFVNPWWSAILVLIIGFVGNVMLTSIFKSYTQLIAIPLVIGSFILVSLYAFSPSTPFQSEINNENKNITHFFKSIDHANSAMKISNQFKPEEKIDWESFNEIMKYKKKALEEARMVVVQKINNKVSGFSNHYRNEFMKGLKFNIQGGEEEDLKKYAQGSILLHSWGKWYTKNYDRFGKYYDGFYK